MTDVDPAHTRPETYARPESRPDADYEYVHTEPTGVSGWVGWIFFAAIIMIMVGLFQVIEGLVGIFNSSYYHVLPSGLVVHVDYTTWGWGQLVLGLVSIATAYGIMVGNLAARVIGIVLAVISAVAHLVFIAAHPAWSVIVITVDVLVIYALAVHGRELRRA
jgi:hypothetical protein